MYNIRQTKNRTKSLKWPDKGLNVGMNVSEDVDQTFFIIIFTSLQKGKWILLTVR